MRKKNSKLAFLFCLPVVAFLTLAIFLVSGFSSGLVFAVGGNGGGLFVGSSSTITIDEGTISGNTATNGGGVYVGNGGKLTIGSYVYFGSYPKTYQSDTSVITTTQDENGYYLGTDGNRYAKVSANPSSSLYVFNNGTKIVSGTEYYFKVEPIKWRILKTENGKALLLCEEIITAMWFDDSTSYSNNYANSEIRAYRNGYSTTYGSSYLDNGFLQTAFTTAEQNSILTTEVDNSASTTSSTSSNKYACENTNDKIFLLSYQDMINTEYGFSSSYSEYDTARRKQTTDYARANYAWYTTSTDYLYNGYYWLRSPASALSGYANRVSHYGSSGYLYRVDDSYYGVVPSLYVDVDALSSIVEGVTISSNTATSGNGHNIYNAGTLTMTGGSVGTSGSSQTGYGIYNEGTMNLFGGTVYDNIYSETSFTAKIDANIQGTITLSDTATITVEDYAGTTPKYKIILESSWSAESIITFQGSTTAPDISKMSITGYDTNLYNLEVVQGSSEDEWKVVLQKIYTCVDEEGNEDENGEYIYFGSYPKTYQSDTSVITTTQDENEYYLGTDGISRYAKISADCGSSYVFNDGTTIVKGTEYYFKVEPIKWRILKTENGKALLLCEDIIDTHDFFAYSYVIKRVINGSTIYANNYKYSDIRAWLNGYGKEDGNYYCENWLGIGFLQTAFTEKERNLILTTEVDNSRESTGNITESKYTCENTNDKIFLLSYMDVINTDYGFMTATSNDPKRMKQPTDFSRAKGSIYSTETDYLYNGHWSSRTPRTYILDDEGMQCYYSMSDSNGKFNSIYLVNMAGGIAPALWLDLGTGVTSFDAESGIGLTGNESNDTCVIQNRTVYESFLTEDSDVLIPKNKKLILEEIFRIDKNNDNE